MGLARGDIGKPDGDVKHLYWRRLIFPPREGRKRRILPIFNGAFRAVRIGLGRRLL